MLSFFLTPAPPLQKKRICRRYQEKMHEPPPAYIFSILNSQFIIRGGEEVAPTAHMPKRSKAVERTPDGRYIIVDGRRWRATNPALSEERRQELVKQLMQARRDVATAKRRADEAAERDARRRVNEAKLALGERGKPWWEQ